MSEPVGFRLFFYATNILMPIPMYFYRADFSVLIICLVSRFFLAPTGSICFKLFVSFNKTVDVINFAPRSASLTRHDMIRRIVWASSQNEIKIFPGFRVHNFGIRY